MTRTTPCTSTNTSRGMQAAVDDAGGVRGVDRLGERGNARQGVLDSQATALAEPGVEGRRLEVLERQPGGFAFDAGRDGTGQTGVPRPGADERGQIARDVGGLLRRRVDAQRLDRDQRTVGLGLGTIDRAEDTNTNLMQDPEGTEGARREKGIREIVVQRETPRPPDRPLARRLAHSDSSKSAYHGALCHGSV